jgi:hypothetical protein
MSCCVCGRTFDKSEPRVILIAPGPLDPAGHELCDECARLAHRRCAEETYWLFPAEYVYTCPWSKYGPPHTYGWCAHRILKKTAKRLWVHTSAISAEHVGTSEENRSRSWPCEKPIVLDRAMLERQGWTRNGRKRSSAFYARPHVERVESQEEIDERAERERYARTWQELRELRRRGVGPTPDDLRVLGVSWPCSAEELKAAYRRLALRAHPDRGGSAEEFRRVNEAYERLMDAV